MFTAPLADLIFYRSYSRPNLKGEFESFSDCAIRVLEGLNKTGNLTEDELVVIAKELKGFRAFPSGRFLWCGGTKWLDKQVNYPGAYNCSMSALNRLEAFRDLMNLAMCGCGTGASVEDRFISQLPAMRNKIEVNVINHPGVRAGEDTLERSQLLIKDGIHTLVVGDSRNGWVEAYHWMFRLAVHSRVESAVIKLNVDLSEVRKKGERLKGFGGVSNPSKLAGLFGKVADILNTANGRKLTSLECSKLINEAALVVVAGNIRRSANIQQGDSFDEEFATAKEGLWQQDSEGNWQIDPNRDCLRMANLTRVYHRMPSAEDIKEAVRQQFYSGEGAIQYAPEAVARANADVITTTDRKRIFIDLYCRGKGKEFLKALLELERKWVSEEDLEDRMARYLLNPCGEVIGKDNFCNLSEVHLNNINPLDFDSQKDAFRAATLSSIVLLHQEFNNPVYQRSRELDPIIGVSFTGLFDFFVKLFGGDWLVWWSMGRPENFRFNFDKKAEIKLLVHLNIPNDFGDNKAAFFRTVERAYLESWQQIVKDEVENYCLRNDLKIPNRCTTVQPAGTKSLLTNASPGWHPPKSTTYLRRVTYAKGDAGAMAAREMGYRVTPGQSDTDDKGNLLNDPLDDRCTEWLVEVPVRVDWADIAESVNVDVALFPIESQFDFYMQVQKHYVTHNTSATLEFKEEEIDTLSQLIYDAIESNEGYISAALLARFNNSETFPRMPFEPISKDAYLKELADVVGRRSLTFTSFQDSLELFSAVKLGEVSPMGCDSDKCLFTGKK